MDKNNTIVIIVAIAIAVVAIIAIIGVIFYTKKKKGNHKILVDEAFIDNLISLYGGIVNIKSVDVENSRLKVTVNDIYEVDLEGLKGLSNSGVFVTSQTIKTLYKFDSELIKKSIEEKI